MARLQLTVETRTGVAGEHGVPGVESFDREQVPGTAQAFDVAEAHDPVPLHLAQGQNPIAAHVFMNELLNPKAAGQNFGYTGYQPPLNQFTPDQLVADEYVPKNLASPVASRFAFAAAHDQDR